MERIKRSMNLPEEKAKAMVESWAAFDKDFMERGGQIMRLRGRFNEILLGPQGILMLIQRQSGAGLL